MSEDVAAILARHVVTYYRVHREGSSPDMMDRRAVCFCGWSFEDTAYSDLSLKVAEYDHLFDVLRGDW